MRTKLLAALLCALTLTGCPWLPASRTVNDIAREACELWAVEEPPAVKLSPKDLCRLPDILAPFLAAQKAARMQAAPAASAHAR